MDHFAGLDVSVKETSVCVVDAEGRIVREAKVASEPEALVALLKDWPGGLKRIGLEAGALSQWLWSALAEAGLPVICVETRQMHAVLKAHTALNKTDRNDARGIAQMMRGGPVPAGPRQDAAQPEDPDAVAAAQASEGQGARRGERTARHVAQLRAQGRRRQRRPLRGAHSRAGRRRWRACRPGGADAAVRRVLREQFAVLHKRLLLLAREDGLVQRLMTIHGVGAVVALSYVASVDVAARFAHSKAVGAAFGLTPSQHQSGETQRQGRVSLCGDAMMRELLYEAAHVMLFRSQKWSWLKAWAMKVARRCGANKAVVALARRLAVVMHRMWMDGTTFRATRETAAAHA